MPELHTCFFDEDSIEYAVKVYYDVLTGFPGSRDLPEDPSEINICTIFKRNPYIYPAKWDRWLPDTEFYDSLAEQCYQHSLKEPDWYEEDYEEAENTTYDA